MMVALRTGQPLRHQLLVEEAEKVELPEPHRALVAAMRDALGDRRPGRGPRTGPPSWQRLTAWTRSWCTRSPARMSGPNWTGSPGPEETLRLLAALDS